MTVLLRNEQGRSYFASASWDCKLERARGVNTDHLSSILTTELARIPGLTLTTGYRVNGRAVPHNPETTKNDYSYVPRRTIVRSTFAFKLSQQVTSDVISTVCATAFKNSGGGNDLSIPRLSNAMNGCQSLATDSLFSFNIFDPDFENVCLDTVQYNDNTPDVAVQQPLSITATSGPITESNNTDLIGKEYHLIDPNTLQNIREGLGSLIGSGSLVSFGDALKVGVVGGTIVLGIFGVVLLLKEVRKA